MRIALIDPFYDVSHKIWAQGLKKNSRYEIDIYEGSPFHWKWKMTGGTMAIARKVNEADTSYDLFLVTDMVNLPLFKSLLKVDFQDIPFFLYFHENQITYPWSPTDTDVEKKRDHHYGFINYSSALVADKIFFNSEYHRKSFLGALPKFLQMFPEKPFQADIDNIRIKSSVLPIGLDLPPFENSQVNAATHQGPIFIWNHRWEYDKNPQLFFTTLFRLKDEGYQFKLIVVGKSYKKAPAIFHKAQLYLEDHIIHFGYAQSIEEYRDLLKQANIILVTSYQDFFGISIVEAISAGCYPLLPDRLSYREHVIQDDAANYIYKEGACLEKLKNVIERKLYLNNKRTSSYVQKYDWNSLIKVYDAALMVVNN